ncbi:precorrin-3B synthase [Bosea sp. TWI1241]|uniref:precorrin-3B synthase n=1 Tax=Bosea sp. TWI1241 TaxID=3148904 RepID=UPI00320A5126
MNEAERVAMRRGWCPGTLRPMETGDGWLVRLHPPRDALTPQRLAAVAELAARHGNGQIEVSSRGNLQLRGVSAGTHPALVAALLAGDLVDEAEGDGPNRLVLASPLAGRAADDRIDAAALAEAVERAGRTVAGVPPKTSIVVDGGGALTLDGFAADLRLRALDTGTVGLQIADGPWFGPLPVTEAPAIAAKLLTGFVALRGALPKPPSRMRALDKDQMAGLAAGLPVLPPPPARPSPAATGLFPERSGLALLAVLPFGRCEAQTLARIADAAQAAGVALIRPTPWRGLAFCGLDADRAERLGEALTGLGQIVAADDPRLGVAVCTGAPGCTRGQAATLADAPLIVAALPPRLAAGLHVSGCAKACAHPGPATLTLTGHGGAYEVVFGGRAGDPPEAVLGLAELVRRLEPGQDIRARLEAAQQRDRTA